MKKIFVRGAILKVDKEQNFKMSFLNFGPVFNICIADLFYKARKFQKSIAVDIRRIHPKNPFLGSFFESSILSS